MKHALILWGGFLLWPVMAQTDPSAGHPRPTYANYSEDEIKAQAEAVRQSRPQMFRGGWAWHRLLTRYVDAGRRETNAVRILHAYFLSILDRYDEAAAKGEGEALNLFPGHGAWGSGGRMRIYEELVRQDLLSAEEQSKFKTMVNQGLKLGYDYSNLERGVNNRPYGMNGGPAIALSLFPDLPAGPAHRRWLEVLWREFADYGDTTEINYYPYGPLFLDGLIDIAEGMGKFETEREFLHEIFKRYRDQVHGGGLRGNPNSGARIDPERRRVYEAPWNAGYFEDEAGALDPHIWYRLAKEFRDPEFLWVSEQVQLGGRPPRGYRIPPEYMRAFTNRYEWFLARGIEPRVPYGKSKIGYYSPLKHRVPERLYLGPGRESGKPFVSFYIYDRNNNYMHCVDDAGGRLYEYVAEGAKFLHTSGKYSSGRAGVAETAYDMLSVLPPDFAFPVNEAGAMDKGSPKAWKMASVAVKFALNCRNGPESDNWYYDTTIHRFRRQDDPEMGFAYGNMDGYWYLNDTYHLTSVRLGLFGAPTTIQNLRLSGPRGEIILAALDVIPENLKVMLSTKGAERRELPREAWDSLLTLVDEGRRPGKSLHIAVPPDSSVILSLEGLDRRFDAQNDYTRVAYDFKGPDASLWLNQRTRPIYHRALYNRGGILVRNSLRAETSAEDDSFGQFTMRNYYGARSRWTRQTVLTREGILVVRDVYEPGPDVDGYNAAPCWLVKAEGEARDRHWVDAPAREHAWWQLRNKRVLLYQHPGRGLRMGQVKHGTSADIGGGPVHNTHARATLRAGKPQVWLSVFRPFNEGEDAGAIAATIKTRVSFTGRAIARIGDLTVSIGEEGRWQVGR